MDLILLFLIAAVIALIIAVAYLFVAWPGRSAQTELQRLKAIVDVQERRLIDQALQLETMKSMLADAIMKQKNLESELDYYRRTAAELQGIVLGSTKK